MRELAADFEEFYDQLVAGCGGLGIDVGPYPVGHVALRTHDLDEYLALRDRIESYCSANVENVWSGRPISKLLLRDPIELGDRHSVDLVELIPPPHRPECSLGVEHIGFVLGEDFDSFDDRFGEVITEQQDQGPFNQPFLIRFADATSVKFHRWSLADVVRREGHEFVGFEHVA